MNATQRHIREVEAVKSAVRQGLEVYALYKNGKIFHHVYSENTAKKAIERSDAEGYKKGIDVLNQNYGLPSAKRNSQGDYTVQIGNEQVVIEVPENAKPSQIIIDFMENLTGRKVTARWMRSKMKFILSYA